MSTGESPSTTEQVNMTRIPSRRFGGGLKGLITGATSIRMNSSALAELAPLGPSPIRIRPFSTNGAPSNVQTICGSGVPVAEHLIDKGTPGRNGSVIVKTVMNVGGSSANANSPLAWTDSNSLLTMHC
ncbi:hypothetical protein DERP_000396 [Dermatophagoides pteronyssinus]|uniref:Uncharacterized protein n=1 Tax=Dermatophagoides pteronyssinus TaxID=6956 RepID=A0ABQ8J093_DERPT|nr:hypothetical protein DERP_000396 [Dermatophagoides pteronyssinus]